MNTSARNAYMGASVSTATPARLLVMLFDRLVLDLQRGRDAQKAGDRETANAQLLHAQDILIELRSSLDLKAWAGAAQLDSIYAWMHTQLISANIHNDVDASTHVLELAEQLRDTWREAAIKSAS